MACSSASVSWPDTAMLRTPSRVSVSIFHEPIMGQRVAQEPPGANYRPPGANRHGAIRVRTCSCLERLGAAKVVTCCLALLHFQSCCSKRLNLLQGGNHERS